MDIVRSKVNITKLFINTTLRGVSYYMAVPDVEKYCVGKLKFEQIYDEIFWSSSFLLKLPEFNL